MSEKKGLAGDSLGAIESVIMGVAGSAPAFSVAVATATLVGVVGVLSVGSLFYCGFVMFGIMLAYVHLSTIAANAGAAYAWVGHVFGRTLGFFTGWGLLVASIIFMVSATIPAATSTLKLFETMSLIKPGLADDTTWVTLTAAVWLTLVTIIVAKGIKHSSYTQITLTGIELSVVVALIIAAFVRFWGSPAHIPSLAWISPRSFTPELFAVGALNALFLYWGWDVTMNLSEETKQDRQEGAMGPASKGAFWAMISLMLFYCIIMITVLLVLSDEEVKAADTNVLLAIANKLFPWPWNYLAALATILSTIGTIETQLLQFSRTMFAMARDDMLHPRYAKIHPEWQTPWVATLVIWGLGVLQLFIWAFMKMDKVNEILAVNNNAIEFQICFYMSLAGFACAWHFRNKFFAGPGRAISYVIWPLLAALFMVFIAVYSIRTFSVITCVLGIGGIVIGVVPLYLSGLRRAWNAGIEQPTEEAELLAAGMLQSNANGKKPEGRNERISTDEGTGR